MRWIVLLPALFFAMGSAVLCAQRHKTVDPVDLVNLKEVEDAQISPEGSVIAYVVTTPTPAGEHHQAHIWLVPADGSSQAHVFALSIGSDTHPRFSPDGKSLAFLSDRENPLAKDGGFHFSIVGAEERQDLFKRDKDATVKDNTAKDESKPESQIWTISLAGGEATPLTNIPGGVKTFKWSKDGRSLGFIRKDQDTKEEEERKKRKDDRIEVDRNYKFDRLWIYTFTTQQARLVTKADINIDDFDWSPDGERFVARVSPTPRIDDYWRVSKIVTIDATTGAVEKTLQQNAAPFPVRWSSDGNELAFGKSSPKTITGGYVFYNLQTGKETPAGASYPATIIDTQWNPDGKGITAAAVQGSDPVFLRVDTGSGSASKIAGSPGPFGWFDSFSISQEGQKLAYTAEAANHPEEVYLVANGQSRVLTDTNPQVADWRLGTSEDLRWHSSKDRRLIYGVLLLPPDYKKGQRYKTVVHVHGGPEEAWYSGFHGSWYDWGTVLASHGYAVLLPNPRGSDGQGLEFTEANYRDWGNRDYQDIMDGVDLLITRGISDPDRLGIGGWSYGGFMASWAVTHTDRFKAAIVGAAITDLHTMATTTDIAPSYLTGYFGDLPANEKLYDEHSPVRYLDHCHTPTLVLHGEGDIRVPISQGEEFYYGLRFRRQDAEMVRYPREPHIFTEMEHKRDSLERMLNWYDSHLGH